MIENKLCVTQILIEKLKTLFIIINIILKMFAKCTRVVTLSSGHTVCFYDHYGQIAVLCGTTSMC